VSYKGIFWNTIYTWRSTPSGPPLPSCNDEQCLEYSTMYRVCSQRLFQKSRSGVLNEVFIVHESMKLKSLLAKAYRYQPLTLRKMNADHPVSHSQFTTIYWMLFPPYSEISLKVHNTTALCCWAGNMGSPKCCLRSTPPNPHKMNTSLFPAKL